MTDVLIVGAGQLGMMTAAAAARFGFSVDRIDHTSGEILPGTSNTRIAKDDDEFATNYQVITAELEHLLGNALVEGLQHRQNWLNRDAMQLLPARDTQKALLDELNVPTSPWCKINSAQDLDQSKNALGNNLVVKSIRDGYDGKGQWIVGKNDDGDIPDSAYGNIIAEAKIDFSRELSIVGARFANNRCHFLPLAENFHQHGMLRYTLAPALNTNTLQAEAENLLARVMEDLDYIGVMAIECFQTDRGLIVNEIAPRVHNSGHWSQLGASYSQFDLHLLSILDKPAPEPQKIEGMTMMLNLIGCEWNPAWQTISGIQTWWYGKTWRENRKLGHINIHGNNKVELANKARALRQNLDEFHQSMLDAALQNLDSV